MRKRYNPLRKDENLDDYDVSRVSSPRIMKVSPRVDRPLQTPEKRTPQFQKDEDYEHLDNYSEQKRQVCLSIPKFHINERSLHFLPLSSESLKDKYLRHFLAHFDFNNDFSQQIVDSVIEALTKQISGFIASLWCTLTQILCYDVRLFTGLVRVKSQKLSDKKMSLMFITLPVAESHQET